MDLRRYDGIAVLRDRRESKCEKHSCQDEPLPSLIKSSPFHLYCSSLSEYFFVCPIGPLSFRRTLLLSCAIGLPYGLVLLCCLCRYAIRKQRSGTDWLRPKRVLSRKKEILPRQLCQNRGGFCSGRGIAISKGHQDRCEPTRTTGRWSEGQVRVDHGVAAPAFTAQLPVKLPSFPALNSLLNAVSRLTWLPLGANVARPSEEREGVY